MRETEGIVRALAVLGDEITKNEAALRHVMNQRDEIGKEADALRAKVKELTEQLKQAEEARDDACRYALKLEKLLEGCKAVYDDLTAGGADKCKKS